MCLFHNQVCMQPVMRAERWPLYDLFEFLLGNIFFILFVNEYSRARNDTKTKLAAEKTGLRLATLRTLGQE